MNKVSLVLLLAFLFPALTPGHDSYSLEKKDSIVKVFKFSSPQKTKTVKIDNVFGSITVSGVKADEVRLEAKKWLRADSQDELQKAEREVTLKMAEKDNVLDIYVDGPFRSRNGSTDCSDRDYTVTYDFALQVPEQTSLVLKTVNDGDILVKNVKGEFIVRNVNGHIELQGIAGPVSGKTVNGRIRAVFSENPTSACSLTTVNGDVDVSFSANLAADFRLKTLNGEIYTDYPDASFLPDKVAAESSRHKGRFIYRNNRSRGMRIGAGGPEIRMETINGDIVLAKNK
jgi:hypothetical protein